MKSVLISIQPKWVEKIASGEKTIEVRKTRPKLETPFKGYIYCTYGKTNENYMLGKRGKVIGEFVCDRIDEYLCEEYEWGDGDVSLEYRIRSVEGRKTCLEYEEIREYGKEKPLYFWHISDLKIYDKPKELGEFYTIDNEAVQKCEHRERVYNNPDYTNGALLLGGYVCNKGETDWCARCKMKPITRPPQSWQFVESLGE